MKKFSLISALCLAFASSTVASTISLTDGGAAGNKFVSSTGQTLTSARIMVGYIEGFSTADTTLMGKLTSGRLEDVLSVFVPLGESFTRGQTSYQIGNTSTITYNTSTGLVSGNVGGVSPLTGTANSFQGSNGVVAGTRLFVLALNQTSLTSLENTQFALVSADPTVTSAWSMPSSNLTNRSLVTTAVDVTSGGGIEYFYGTKGSIQLQPVAVPEPSLFAILAIGLALGLRRKKS